MERELFLGEEIWDGTDDCLGHLAYMDEVANEEGTLDRLQIQLDDIHNEEATKFAFLVSQQPEPSRPQPSHTSMVMTSCVSKNEEVRMALEATSASLPTPALDAPPALVITMDASVPNWPWGCSCSST
jgi:hypothetical protein